MREEFKSEISAWVEAHRSEMLSDIVDLCRIDSADGTPEPGKPFGEGAYRALKRAEAMANQYGFRVTNYDNYASAFDLNDGESRLDILAHMDVVPGGEGWTVTGPFDPAVQDGKLYGRGTSDDKGPAVAALYAMRAVKELGIPVSRNARLILGCNEESGSRCIAHYYKTEKEAPMTFSPDGDYPVVNVEKGRMAGEFSASWERQPHGVRILSVTGGAIENAVPQTSEAVVTNVSALVLAAAQDQVMKETGVLITMSANKDEKLKHSFRITAAGKEAHASTPEKGNNALTAMLLFLSKLPLSEGPAKNAVTALVRLIPHGEWDGASLGIKCEDSESGPLTLAFSKMEFTETGFRGLFDCRFPATAKGAEIAAACEKSFGEAGISFDGSRRNEGHLVPADSPLVTSLLEIYESYTGLKGECIALGGQTYVHELQNGVAFGAVFPGTDTHMHEADEYAVIDELAASAKMFAQAIADLCE